jgi:hypothetical protein
MNDSEESTEELRAAFRKWFGRAMKTQSESDHKELRKVEDKLQARYFGLIERIEQKFEDIILSGSEIDVQHFLMDHNFIFGALSTNVAIYIDYRLTNEMSVDCIVIGEKYFALPSITFVKLEQARFNSFDTEKEVLDYLTPSINQVKQWSNWLTTSANVFEKRLREQIHKDLPSINYPSTHPNLEFLLEFAIIVSHKSVLTQKQLHLLRQINTSLEPVKIMTYDSLFQTIYDTNKKVLMSSGWWTEDICASENVPTLGNHSLHEI